MASSYKRSYSLCSFAVFGGEVAWGKKRPLEPKKTTFCESHCFITFVPKFACRSTFRVHQGYLFDFHTLKILEIVSLFIFANRPDFRQVMRGKGYHNLVSEFSV